MEALRPPLVLGTQALQPRAVVSGPGRLIHSRDTPIKALAILGCPVQGSDCIACQVWPTTRFYIYEQTRLLRRNWTSLLVRVHSARLGCIHQPPKPCKSMPAHRPSPQQGHNISTN